MLSDATYGRLASTNVLTDFVELPSQLMEHWFSERQVLKEFARHFETGEVVPEEILEKLEAAESFNQGFGTIEYTICALLDMAMHQLEDYDDFDLIEFNTHEFTDDHRIYNAKNVRSDINTLLDIITPDDLKKENYHRAGDGIEAVFRTNDKNSFKKQIESLNKKIRVY